VASVTEILPGAVGKNISQYLPNIQGVAEALAGYSPNEFFTVLLKGPDYKNYSFTWAFFPKNKEESDQIKNIVRTLNNAMAVKFAAGGTFWGFPNVFRLSYFPNSQYLNKFKNAAMKSLEINSASFYAQPQGPHSSKPANPPEAVIIKATFEEMEYWVDGDFTDNNYPLDVGSRS
jgi:hypothetical protein